MVIGHNPAVQGAALVLGGAGEARLVAEISAKFPTGALVVIDFDSDDWSAISPGDGRVTAFIKPRDLENDGPADDGD